MVGIGVLVVHFLADFHAPLGHREGKPNINRNRDHHDDRVPNTKVKEQNPRNHQQLHDQRANRKQQEAEQEFYTFYTAFNDTAEAARFAGDVIAHRQAVNMGEGFKRQRPQRALPDLCENHIAQLLQPNRQHPRKAVCQHQTHSAKAKVRRGGGLFWGQSIDRLAKEDRGHNGDNLRQE